MYVTSHGICVCVFPNNYEWWNGALLMIGGECAAAFQMDCSKTKDDGSVLLNEY